MDKETILKLLEDDEFGLLKTKQKPTNNTADERLIASFQEINDFIEKNGNAPEANPSDVMEFRLYSRLKGFNEDSKKALALSPFDQFSILKPIKPIESVDDVFNDDSIGLLDDEAESIFQLKHVQKSPQKPDYFAKRKPCKDFKRYESLFKECQADLAEKRRVLSPFSGEQQIFKGQFFVLKGILLYIADEGERENNNGKVNARLRCIFENGTESNMLLRSLAAELYKDGRRVSAHEEHLLDGLNSITDEDEQTGQIYVLRSLSTNSDIASVKNLYKIGFSKQSIESRIQNAEKDPTFLMAPVKLVTSFRCYNLNPQKLEQLIHTFFGEACLNVDIYDSNGKRHIPREWFVAPLDVIEQSIKLLNNGEIVNYKYDRAVQEVVLKK